MRILFHCLYYRPEVGGLESHASDLAEGLARRGHEVRVVTSRSRPGLETQEELSGVLVHRVWMPWRSPSGWVTHSFASVPLVGRWAGWADVLHAQSFASAVPIGLAARRAGRPWVASFHTSHFLVRAERPTWRPILRRIVRWPDHALAASREIAEVAECLAPGTRVEPMTNGVDTERFRPVEPTIPVKPGERTIVVPRRLFPKNGVEHIVRAIPRIRETFPTLRVVVVGDGPERAALEGLADSLGVSETVQFLGVRPRLEMPGILCSGELAVFPSLMEATSVAALEAMACERPVVATDVGGLPEIVDESVGTLVPPGDPGALADGVTRLLQDPALAEKGSRGRERVVRRWSNDRLVERHVEIYGDLVERRPVREPHDGTSGEGGPA